MNEAGTCETCAHKAMLKHNFAVGKGFEETLCCTALAKVTDGYVLEVTPNDRCEIYRIGVVEKWVKL